jgi:hypothetical protein
VKALIYVERRWVNNVTFSIHVVERFVNNVGKECFAIILYNVLM